MNKTEKLVNILSPSGTPVQPTLKRLYYRNREVTILTQKARAGAVLTLEDGIWKDKGQIIDFQNEKSGCNWLNRLIHSICLCSPQYKAECDALFNKITTAWSNRANEEPATSEEESSLESLVSSESSVSSSSPPPDPQVKIKELQEAIALLDEQIAEIRTLQDEIATTETTVQEKRTLLDQSGKSKQNILKDISDNSYEIQQIKGQLPLYGGFLPKMRELKSALEESFTDWWLNDKEEQLVIEIEKKIGDGYREQLSKIDSITQLINKFEKEEQELRNNLKAKQASDSSLMTRKEQLEKDIEKIQNELNASEQNKQILVENLGDRTEAPLQAKRQALSEELAEYQAPPVPSIPTPEVPPISTPEAPVPLAENENEEESSASESIHITPLQDADPQIPLLQWAHDFGLDDTEKGFFVNLPLPEKKLYQTFSKKFGHTAFANLGFAFINGRIQSFESKGTSFEFKVIKGKGKFVIDNKIELGVKMNERILVIFTDEGHATIEGLTFSWGLLDYDSKKLTFIPLPNGSIIIDFPIPWWVPDALAKKYLHPLKARGLHVQSNEILDPQFLTWEKS